MAWIRLGVFISLTLVATTLPAGGMSAPAQVPSTQVPSTQSPGQACPDSSQGSSNGSHSTPVHSPSRHTPDDSGPLLQAASQLDVWKSAPTRPLGHCGQQLIATLAQAAPAVWKPSPASGRDLQSNAARVREHAREWLTCRYPNAPPCLA